MLVVFIRAVILFAVVFIAIRLMGKRELSKVQPFELAIIIMMSDIASGPMSSRQIPLFSGVIPILTLLVLYIIFTLIIQSGKKIETAVCGSPSLIIFKGKILEEEMKKQQLTIEELMSQLREKDIYQVSDTAYAILETSGSLNAIKISEAASQMPLNIISQGEYLENNLQILKITKEEAEKIIQEQNLNIKDILIGTINEVGKFTYQLKEGK